MAMAPICAHWRKQWSIVKPNPWTGVCVETLVMYMAWAIKPAWIHTGHDCKVPACFADHRGINSDFPHRSELTVGLSAFWRLKRQKIAIPCLDYCHLTKISTILDYSRLLEACKKFCQLWNLVSCRMPPTGSFNILQPENKSVKFPWVSNKFTKIPSTFPVPRIRKVHSAAVIALRSGASFRSTDFQALKWDSPR